MLFRSNFKNEQHCSGPTPYAAELGSTVFELYPSRGDSGPGRTRIGFRAASLDRLTKSLESRNATIISAPQVSPWGRRAVVEDPDENRIELTQIEEV